MGSVSLIRNQTLNPDTYQKTLNEHGGWITKDKEEWAKWWPELAEKKRLHTEQMKAHIPVHQQENMEKLGRSTTLLFMRHFSLPCSMEPTTCKRIRFLKYVLFS